jgi:glyoxylase-like metal-dependent hydrolase (beta-lactamase superfamily II)
MVMEILKGIYLFDGTDQDSNIYLIDGEVLIDAGTGFYFSEIKKEIEKLTDTEQIRLLINTHHHFDHTGGDKKFRDWLKCELGIHNADKESLESGKTLPELFGASPKIVTVDKTLRQGLFIKTKSFNFEVLHTPGHTSGSICLYDKNKKILISGDTLFADSIGRVDLPGSDSEAMLDSLRTLDGLQINYLLPGHGSPRISGANFIIKRMLETFRIKPIATRA